MCTREDALAHNLGAPCMDDVMSYNSLTTILKPNSPTIQNLNKQLPSWISIYWFSLNDWEAIAVAMVPIILILNHPKSEHQNIWISNGF